MELSKGIPNGLGDKESFKALTEGMESSQLAEFEGYKFVRKFPAFKGAVLVIYTLGAGKPTDIDVVTLTGLRVDGRGAVAYAKSNRTPNIVEEILQTPTKWRGRELFLFTPQTFEFRWRGKNSPERGLEFAAHYAILVKTKGRDDEMIEGHTYCVSFNDFRNKFPGTPLRY